MAEFGFDVIPKNLFFDRQRVIKAIKDGTKSALSKAGAFVMVRARTITGRRGSKKKRTAPRGAPPYQHSSELHRLIFFAYDESRKAVDVGPVRFGKGEAPALLEFARTATRRLYNPKSKRRDGKTYTAHYGGNPFMAPSLAEADSKGVILDAWKDCVRS